MNLQERWQARIAEAISERVFPGCVVGMVSKKGIREILAHGTTTYESADPVLENSIYDLASVTKSIPTASLALELLDQGKIKLDDQVITYVPELENAEREAVLVKHLLTYTIPGFGMSRLKDLPPDELSKIILTTDFGVMPGTVFQYSNVASFLLGLVVERAGGLPLDCLADELFFQPLGMSDTSFHPKNLDQKRIVPTEECSWRGHLVCGEVHDESAHAYYTKAAQVVGYAGLFSTVPDLLNFLEMLINKGDFGGRRYLTQASIEAMSTNQLASIGAKSGLGWALAEPRYMGKYSGPKTFGKTGFTGTMVLCDPLCGFGLVMLSNRIYPERPADSQAINAVRADLADIVFEEFLK